MQVFKFGGASVKDVASLRNVSLVLSQYAKEPTIVVVSAMGKITNKLEALVNAYFYKEGDVIGVLQEIKDFHTSILDGLFSSKTAAIYDEIENVFVELLWALEDEPSFSYDYHYDQIVSQGEVLSTKIVSAFLKEKDFPNKWLDARDVIQTDNSYREGRVNYELSQKLTESTLLPLLKQGGALLMLVKPQFELQPSDIGKGGLVKDEASYVQVESRLREACAALQLDVLGYWPSAIAGGDGNKEFWIGARRA